MTLHHAGLAFGTVSSGDATDPTVLCLHGFPDHPPTLRALVGHLGAHGYHAVAPWLRGYEPSSQPADHDYSLAALAADVVGWLDDLDVARAHVVGHDWGAVVAYAAANLAPDRIRSVVGVAVPPFDSAARPGPRAFGAQLRKSWYMGLFQLPAVPERVVSRDGWAFVARLWRAWSPGFALPAAEWEALTATLSAPGVLPAALAYYRTNLRRPRALVRLTRTPPVPTLLVTGADDGCIDTRLYAGRTAETRRIDRAGHWVHREQPDMFTKLLLAWLADH